MANEKQACGMTLQAPFPWFGGKRKVAAEVWRRFGKIENYVEPFFGSGAVLLGRPQPVNGNETINDLDGFVANFWRSLKMSPEKTAEWADNPVNENDLHGRHSWLVGQAESLRARLEGDPEFHDPKIAGWWVWGIACWIGSGFCSGNGPWHVIEVTGDNGRGVNRQLVHLGNGLGVNRKLVRLSGHSEMGINAREDLLEWFEDLAERFRRVRVCSGDWARVCGPSVTFKHGITGVFFDPPYADTANRTEGLYREDSLKVAHDVRDWAVENGKNPLMKIALCGYEGEHEMPIEWAVHSWNASDGFAAQAHSRGNNGRKERIWFSPSCDKSGDFFI